MMRLIFPILYQRRVSQHSTIFYATIFQAHSNRHIEQLGQRITIGSEIIEWQSRTVIAEY
jgi:hypothetical protein